MPSRTPNMEAACAPGEVVAIEGDNGELTIIRFEAGSTLTAVDSCVQNGSAPQTQTNYRATPVPAIQPDTDREYEGKNIGDIETRTTTKSVELPGEEVDVRNEVSIQANDYEIERATGVLPARKRFIPLKYRDFRSSDEIEGDDRDDSDYEPEPIIEPKEPKKKRGRGRPRKHSDAGADKDTGSGGKRPLMMRTPNGYKCLTCNRVFSQKDTIDACQLFGFTDFDLAWGSQGNLKVHLLTHTDQRPWHCDIDNCDKGFRTKESLRRHKLSHMGIKPFECSECKKKFCSAFSLQEHMSLHSNERPYTCSECQRAFRQISCLRRHLLTHSSDMPHTCEVCGRKFSQAVYLRSHMKVHTGEKPFSCDQCCKSFAHASDLTRHKIIHSGSKPYSCSVCSMRFSDPSSRRRHEREHVGTKAYSCHLCSEGFKRASQLRAHLFRRHGGLKEGVEFEIQDGPEPVCYRIELHQTQGEGSEVNATKVVDLTSLDQKKILSLIQNLNRDMIVQEVEVASAETMVTGATSEGDVEKTMVTDTAGATLQEQAFLPVEVAAVMEKGENIHSSIVAVSEMEEGTVVQDTYQIMQQEVEGGGDGNSQPVYEVRYHAPAPAPASPLSVTTALSETTSTLSVVDASSSSTVVTPHPSSEDQPAASTSSLVESPVNASACMAVYLNSQFVCNPDFGSQDYYDWLSSFTEVCKMLSVPLEVDLFQRISQVHKSLSDFMASPSGVISDKDNFKILMSISKDLGHILEEHLTCMFQNLSEGTAQK